MTCLPERYFLRRLYMYFLKNFENFWNFRSYHVEEKYFFFSKLSMSETPYNVQQLNDVKKLQFFQMKNFKYELYFGALFFSARQ